MHFSLCVLCPSITKSTTSSVTTHHSSHMCCGMNNAITTIRQLWIHGAAATSHFPLIFPGCLQRGIDGRWSRVVSVQAEESARSTASFRLLPPHPYAMECRLSVRMAWVIGIRTAICRHDLQESAQSEISVHSFVHSFVRSFVRSFVHSSVRSLMLVGPVGVPGVE